MKKHFCGMCAKRLYDRSGSYVCQSCFNSLCRLLNVEENRTWVEMLIHIQRNASQKTARPQSAA